MLIRVECEARVPMKLDIYLNYAGNCQEAFRFYEKHLRGKITMMMTHGEGPNAANLTADEKKAILHSRIEIGNTVVMGADIPKSEPMRSAYLTLTVETAEDAERLYALLSLPPNLDRCQLPLGAQSPE